MCVNVKSCILSKQTSKRCTACRVATSCPAPPRSYSLAILEASTCQPPSSLASSRSHPVNPSRLLLVTMSSKLDQSLDTIMDEAGTRGGRRGRGRPRRGARAVPVGGVRKSTRIAAPTAPASRTATKANAHSNAASATGGSAKVIVSNLVWSTIRSHLECILTSPAQRCT